MPELDPITLVTLAAVGVVLYWVGLTSVIAWLSGWRALAEAYPARRPFRGQPLRFASAVLRGNARYNAVLTIGADVDGVYMAVFPLFRAGHPPLYIPWSAITVAYEQRWGVRGARFHFRATPDVTMFTRGRLAARLLRDAPPGVAPPGMP